MWMITCTFQSSCLLSIRLARVCFADHPLCVSVPPHDVKRMAWNSTVNSSCPDSELSQSSMPAAPLGSNTVAAKSNTKQSKSTSALTDPSFPCCPLTAAVPPKNTCISDMTVFLREDRNGPSMSNNKKVFKRLNSTEHKKRNVRL